MQGLPIGTIVPWSGAPDTIPLGWDFCNGAVIQITKYPLLYKIIGNVYGGTAGSTFKMPEITEDRGVMDIYPGHYSSLSAYIPSKPSTTTKSSDPYWTNIGENINVSNSTDGSSTIDVIASFINPTNKPKLVASVKEIEFTAGTFATSYSINGRKLSDRHQKYHNHTTSFEGDTDGNSFRSGGRECSANSGGRNSTCTFNSKGGVASNTLGNRNVPSKADKTICKGGSDPKSNASGMTDNGNGYTGGDMYAVQGGGVYNLASSLSADGRSWSDLSAHTHNSPDTKFKCNVTVVSDYTFYDVNSNSITINAAPPDVATINISTATANLSMIFIIRAY